MRSEPLTSFGSTGTLKGGRYLLGYYAEGRKILIADLINASSIFKQKRIASD